MLSSAGSGHPGAGGARTGWGHRWVDGGPPRPPGTPLLGLGLHPCLASKGTRPWLSIADRGRVGSGAIAPPVSVSPGCHKGRGCSNSPPSQRLDVQDAGGGRAGSSQRLSPRLVDGRLLSVSSHGRPSVWVCVLISSSYKTVSSIKLRPTLMTSVLP